MNRVRYLNRLEDVRELTPEEREKLSSVAQWFRFRTTDYYLSLIQWDDPHDPIRRIIIPSVDELDGWGRKDPSKEARYTALPGVQHKYPSTVLFLASGECAGYCRYCFRKRLFTDDTSEVLEDLDAAVRYVRAHPEITNVLLTGGDPMILSSKRLGQILDALAEIPHVQIVRIGTRILSYNPYRVIGDPELIPTLQRFLGPQRRIYIVTHFNHPRELTNVALLAVRKLLRAGMILANQTPLIRGVNDRPDVLAQLFRKLSFGGVPPYYIFQIRPAVGNRPFAVPVEEGYRIFERAKARVSGLAKRARFVMSHASGKIEVVGLTHDLIFFKYHRSARREDSGRFLAFKRNPDAYWFDDYSDPVFDAPVIRKKKTSARRTGPVN